MITALSLADGTGTDVSLMPSDKVLVTDVDGLWGVESPRQVKRPRPTGSGALNDTRFGDGRLMSVAWDVSGTDQADTLTQFHTLTAPMVDTWDIGAAALKWTVAGDARQGLTNLITNPSFETGTTGWSGPNATISQDTTHHDSGSYALKMVRDSSVNSFPVWASYALTVPSAGTYYAQARVWVPASYSGSQTLVFRTENFTNQGPQFDSGATVDLSKRDQWQTVTTVVFTVDAGDLTGTVVLREQSSSSVAGDTLWLDSVMVVQSPVIVSTYFDGDSEYAYWTGTPHASTSTLDASLQRLVKLDSDVTPHVVAGDDKRLVFQAQFFAEDPRAYHARQQSVTSSTLSAATGGLVFNAKFPWKFTPSSGGAVTVTNRGNRKTPPIFRIYGLAVNPQVLIVGSTTSVITINGTIASGTYLEVDVLSRTATVKDAASNTSLGVQNNLIDSVNTFWFELSRGVSNLQMTSGSFDSNAKLTVLWRDAYA